MVEMSCDSSKDFAQPVVDVDRDAVFGPHPRYSFFVVVGIASERNEVRQPGFIGDDRSADLEDSIEKIIDKLRREIPHLGLRARTIFLPRMPLRKRAVAMSPIFFAMRRLMVRGLISSSRGL